MKNNPAVSVIIPMYNAGKYIGDCLNSLLGQTFQDFELIVVDDCSTDDSVAIVEGYMPKFNGRLKLSKTQTNSGGGGYVPRNIGFNLSCGEYIFFVDADDFIVERALELLYTAATQTQAEVVYTSAYYTRDGSGELMQMLDLENALAKEKDASDEPTLTINDPNKNLQRLLFRGNFPNPWTKFIRRDFLIENAITFPAIISGGDFIWVINVYCYAKRLLTLPIPLYFYRSHNAESVSHKKRTPPEQVSHWVSAFVLWLEAFDELLKKTAILKQNPLYYCQALSLHFNYCLGCCSEERMRLDTQDIYEALYRKFDGSSAVPFFFSMIDAQQKELSRAQRRIAELEDKLKAKE
ncbi:MAG: glycosyltransferase [Quinella sp. 1Q5]|nr:glycosyltransferase [Quinella sp. 1Q5]